MPKLSKFERMPEEIKKQIHDLRKAGATIDEIQTHLGTLNVSVARSTTAKYVAAEIDAVGREMRNTAAIAAALIPHFGEGQEDRLLRMNTQILKSAIFKVLRAEMAKTGEDQDSNKLQRLSKSLKDVQSAEAYDAAVKFKMRKEFTKEAADAVDKVAKARGLSADTVDAIKSEILGIKSAAPEQP